MSSRLLPGEKPRQKKDAGTTTYKKPGPPTPSKHGGRVSLENKVHPKEVLRELHDNKTPKRVTPNRIRMLFLGKGNSSTRDSSEVGSTAFIRSQLSYVNCNCICHLQSLPVKNKHPSRKRNQLRLWNIFVKELTTYTAQIFVIFTFVATTYYISVGGSC